MKLKFVIFIVLIMVFILSCIKRDNPLDPSVNNDIIVPAQVNNFDAQALSPTVVKLTWDKNTGVSGYYIYRSMSINGDYIRVDNNRLNDENYEEFLDENPTFVSNTFYWYKISAYKTYNGKNLEGYRSDPIYVYIP